VEKIIMRTRWARTGLACGVLALAPLGAALTATEANALPGGCTYQSGYVEQDYNQDNSGTANDTTTVVQYVPEQFGAPHGAQIIVGSATVSPHVYRGAAQINWVNKAPNAISFEVWTQAAGGFIFGHHSGGIDIHTSFTWYAYTGCG
jgi:hypothetical protein